MKMKLDIRFKALSFVSVDPIALGFHPPARQCAHQPCYHHGHVELAGHRFQDCQHLRDRQPGYYVAVTEGGDGDETEIAEIKAGGQASPTFCPCRHAEACRFDYRNRLVQGGKGESYQ